MMVPSFFLFLYEIKIKVHALIAMHFHSSLFLKNTSLTIEYESFYLEVPESYSKPLKF